MLVSYTDLRPLIESQPCGIIPGLPAEIIMAEQLELDFGPDFPETQIKRNEPLYALVMALEVAIAQQDYGATKEALSRLKVHAWSMFWEPLQAN